MEITKVNKWDELKLAASDFKATLRRDWMLRRYSKWTQGEIPLEDRFVDGLVKAQTYLLTSWRSLVKNTLDFFLCFFGLFAALPVFAAVGIAIKVSSKGPVFYRQTRVGKNGRIFTMYKFRTMTQDAEAKSGPIWAKEDDPRVTPLGRFLRKTHLDELPQLLNVLKGEMSLVGPRPERPYFVNEFRKVIPHYEKRLCAKPGITGLAQIRQGYDQTLSDVKKKLRYDVLYIQKMCPLLDVKVMALTVLSVTSKTGRA